MKFLSHLMKLSLISRYNDPTKSAKILMCHILFNDYKTPNGTCIETSLSKSSISIIIWTCYVKWILLRLGSKLLNGKSQL